MGMLPIPGADSVYKALDYLNSKGGLEGALKQNSLTLNSSRARLLRDRGSLPT